MLEIVAEELREPLLSAADLETVKKRLIGEREIEKNTTRKQCEITYSRLLFPVGHPNWSTTSAEEIEQIKSVCFSRSCLNLTRAFALGHCGGACSFSYQGRRKVLCLLRCCSCKRHTPSFLKHYNLHVFILRVTLRLRQCLPSRRSTLALYRTFSIYTSKASLLSTHSDFFLDMWMAFSRQHRYQGKRTPHSSLSFIASRRRRAQVRVDHLHTHNSLKPSKDVLVGLPIGINRRHADFYPFVIGSYILGGNFSARLNQVCVRVCLKRSLAYEAA